MKSLPILQQITPPHITKATPSLQSNQPLRHNRRETPFLPPKTWRLHSGPKGFTGSTKDREPIAKKSNTTRNGKNYIEDDEKIPEVVWERMISRILFYFGVPLGIGFVLLQVFNVLKGQELWDVPKWLPYLTTFVTFGASALGIAYGSLSTSLDAEEEGSFFGFEQVEKNWGEMWKEENDNGDRKRGQITKGGRDERASWRGG
ncbi:hypothetical protein CDL12_11071 [Handroanthus impetiginosus]|uniref:Protein PAM68, chloroplastic n=1 Tax=Handroanthus impetiginosus TaxID=429701 RepID=A0A2G9HFI7_9LAMI|nr:hypothetical protein CDL12_11071 [Handroanthus impetiginosus]